MESSTLNDTQLDALFSSHNLDYTPPESSNLILSRTSCDKEATLNQYESTSNNSIDVYIGSDNELLWGPSSYLSFDLLYSGDAKARLEDVQVYESVVAKIFSRITISCKGTMIYDVDGFGQLNAIENMYSCPKAYMESTGSLEGYGLNWKNSFQPVDGTGNPLNKGTTVAMPLHNISFFAQDKFIPLLALSPLKVSFYLNKAASVFQTTAADPTGKYTIKNFKMNLDLCVPQDVVRVGILKLVKQQILTLSYPHYNHLNSPLAAGSNTINLRKSVQKCQSIVTKLRTRTEPDEFKISRFNALPYSNVNAWHYNAGCKRMPSNPVINAVDAYILAANAYGTYTSCTRPPAVGIAEFAETGSVLAMDLEKDVTAPAMLSGISLNSTDDISLNVDVKTIPATIPVTTWQADTFLSYLRLVVVGTSNISIKE